MVASPKFQNSGWVNEAWNLSRFGSTSGAVIDAGGNIGRALALCGFILLLCCVLSSAEEASMMLWGGAVRPICRLRVFIGAGAVAATWYFFLLCNFCSILLWIMGLDFYCLAGVY